MTVIGLAIVVASLAAAAAHATVLPWMSLEDVTAKAELIVLGRVETSVAGWSDDGRIIVTRATVSVERALKGGPRARVEVKAPGGRIGDVGMIAAGAPVFHVGDRVVLFLEAAGSGAGGGAPRRHAVVGWNLGKMDVTRDPRTGREAYAVVQLRQEDRAGRMWNLVGFQTRLRIPEQQRRFLPKPPRAEKTNMRAGDARKHILQYVSA